MAIPSATGSMTEPKLKPGGQKNFCTSLQSSTSGQLLGFLQLLLEHEHLSPWRMCEHAVEVVCNEEGEHQPHTVVCNNNDKSGPINGLFTA
jgi:hypothetical protein